MSRQNQTTKHATPSMWSECTACWQSLPGKTVFFVLLAAWLALFHFLGNSTLGYVDTPSLFGWWFWVCTRGVDVGGNPLKALNQILGLDEAHIWVMPIVVAGLLWWRRRQLAGVPKEHWWPALGLLALALSLHILGYMVQQTRFSIAAFFLGLFALMGLVWGREWLRATCFPFFLLVFCIPLGDSAQYVTFPLRLLATKITTFLAHNLLGIDVVQNGTSIWEPTGRFQYEVAAACSGIRSLTAIFALATIYGFTEFPKNWQRFLLIASAFPLAVVGNVIRLLTIIMAAEAFGQSAGNYVHENAVFSLLPYLPVMIGLGALGHWLSKFKFERTVALEPKTA